MLQRVGFEGSSRPRLPRAGTIAVALAVFLPGLSSLVSRYGYSDDYWFLGYEKSGSDLIHDLSRDHGRPLLGLVYAIGRPMVGTIDGLWRARLVGLVGVVALALAVRAAARAAGFSERFAVTLGIGVGLLPGAQLYAVWASGSAAWLGERCCRSLHRDN